MRNLFLASILTIGSSLGAMADDIIKITTQKSVTDAADALEAAVGKAGATVFARVDHAGGAAKVDLELAPAQLLIFGNPKLGTPAMQDDPLAGLFLPLRVLVYRDGDGQVWLSYEDPAAMLGKLDGVPDGADYVQKMTGALGKLTAAAAN